MLLSFQQLENVRQHSCLSVLITDNDVIIQIIIAESKPDNVLNCCRQIICNYNKHQLFTHNLLVLCNWKE